MDSAYATNVQAKAVGPRTAQNLYRVSAFLYTVCCLASSSVVLKLDLTDEYRSRLWATL